MLEERNPKTIAIDRSTVFAFSDGLSSGELAGMSAMLGAKWTSRFKDAEALPLELIAVRLPDEEAFFAKMTELVWAMTQEMFSAKTITPGTTRTSDLVWWWRQRVNDLGLGTWFQPSVDVQRRGATEADLGADPIIQRGDVLHCDVGITAARLNTDTQHLAYVLREGETDAPAGLGQALANANRMQDLTLEELRPGRSGNEILKAMRARMKAAGIDGTQYTPSHRPARPRRRADHRAVGLPGRRARTRRRAGHPEHVVLDRVAGDHAGTRVGRAARAHGPGRGRDHRRCRQGPLGPAAAGSLVPGEVSHGG